MSASEHCPGLAPLLALLLSLTGPLAAHAQAPKSPVTEADIARAARSQPTITDKDIEAAARKNRMPTEAELARVPVPATPRIDALPQPQTQRKIDLGAIAGGYDAMGQPDPSKGTLPVGPTLLVFVSFSMPDAALERLADQAARSGAISASVSAAVPRWVSTTPVIEAPRSGSGVSLYRPRNRSSRACARSAAPGSCSARGRRRSPPSATGSPAPRAP